MDQRDPATSHRALKTLLAVLGALVSAGALVLLFATGPLLAFLHVDAVGFGGLWLAFTLRSLGAMAVFMAYLLFIAARDPVRNVAVVDAVAILLIVGVLVDGYAIAAMHLGVFYPTWAIVVRIAVRIGVAVALIALRPKTGGT